MSKKYYITTTLPYVNSVPHIGHALEMIRADVLARWHKHQGEEIFFNTGIDEHGLKIYRKAEELGISPQAYCDQMTSFFTSLKELLNLDYNSFIRTTDPKHENAAREFWKRCLVNGDIYKKNYQVKYCVGCELEKTESELIAGRCQIHSNQELELINEENYFFRFSKYADRLLMLYRDNPDFVVPRSRLNEITSFVERGLEDFSISRLKTKMPWGVAVPDDEDQVMYVWFDALINYISCLGWPDDCKFDEFWPGVQICGKDNLRQQSAMWQAMLMSAGLANSRQIIVNGFITSDGQKMSKSLGNVVDPKDLVMRFGTDAVRYYLLSEITLDDGDFSFEKFTTKFNSDLANGLGNLVARVSTLLEKNNIETNLMPGSDTNLRTEVDELLNRYNFSGAIFRLWQEIARANEIITNAKPWSLVDKHEIKDVLEPVAQMVMDIAWNLRPFLPETAEKIIINFKESNIKKSEALFPRLN